MHFFEPRSIEFFYSFVWVYYRDSLTSKVGQSFIKLYQNGAAQPNLGAKSVAKYGISLPSVGEQTRLVEKIRVEIGQVEQLRAIYRNKFTALDELKQSILQKAFKGEL